MADILVPKDQQDPATDSGSDPFLDEFRRRTGAAPSPVQVLPGVDLAPPADDPFLDEFNRRKQLNREQVSRDAVKVNPDKYAETLKLSEASDLPEHVVERNQEVLSQQQRASEIGALLSGSPITERWFDIPENRKIAHDSIESLTNIEKTLTYTRAYAEQIVDLSGMLARGAGELNAIMARGVSAPLEAALRSVGAENVIELLRSPVPFGLEPTTILKGLGEGVGRAAKQVGPEDKDRGFDTEVFGGLGQLTGQITAMYLLSPAAAGGILLGMGLDQSAQDVEQSGASGTVAGDVATVGGGAVTALTEKFGLNLILDKIPAAYRSRLMRTLSSASVEAVQEISEGVLRNLTAVALYDPTRDVFKDVENDGSVAGVVGAIAGAIIPGRQSLSWKEKLDEAHKELAKSPLTERSPERAAQHVAEILRENGVGISISSDAFLTFSETTNTPLEEVFSRFGATEQMQEAISRGGDVRVSEEVFAKEVMLSEDYDLFAENTRFGVGALTVAEVEEFKKDGISGLMQEQKQPEGNVYDLEADQDQLREIAYSYHPDDAVAAENAYVQAVKDEGYDGVVKDGKTVLFEAPKETAEAPEIAEETKSVVTLAEHEMGLAGIIKSVREVGGTAANAKQLLIATRQSAEANRRAYQQRVARQEQRKLTSEWKQEKAKVADDVAQQVRSEPVYAAMDSIGVDRLDRSAVIEALDGKADIEMLPKQQGRHLYGGAKEAGVHPEILAQRYEFNSAQDMLLAMVDSKPIVDIIAERVDAEMNRRHKDLSDRIEAKKAAIRDLHNDQTEAMLLAEVEALDQAKKQGRVKLSVLKAAAKERLRDYKMSDVKPMEFLEEQKKKATLVGKLIRKGDWRGAFKAKLQQLLNFEYAREAYRIEDRLNRRVAALKKLADPSKSHPGVDADYIDKVQEILAGYNFGSLASDATKESLNAQAILDWKAAQEKDEGAVLNIPSRLLMEANTIHYSDMTVNDFYALSDTVNSLMGQGRRIKANQNLLDATSFAAHKKRMLEAAEKLPSTARSLRQAETLNARGMDRAMMKLAELNASLDKVELMLQDLDGEVIGPWHKAIFAPVADAQTKELDMEKLVLWPLIQELEKGSPAMRKRLHTVYDIPLLGIKARGSEILMIALNSGNEVNYKKMLQGMSKKPRGLKWTDAGVDQALSHLGAEEAAWVQKVWDAFEGLYPDVQAIYRAENSGKLMKKQPRELAIGGVKVSGGYFTIMYDPEYSEQRNKTPLEMLQDPVYQGAVFSGMTEAVVEEYSAPMLLDIKQLYPALKHHVHFITHYDAVRKLNKILDDRELAQAVKEKLGEGYHDQIKKWIGAVASSSGSRMSEIARLDSVFQYFRGALTAATLGASGSTGLMQTLGLSTSVAVLGKKMDGSFSSKEGMKWMAVGLDRYASDPSETIRMAGRLSGEIRHRIGNADREISQTLEHISNSSGFGKLWREQQRLGLTMISGIQFYSVDLPTWVGAYNQGLSRNMTGADAVLYADSILRTSQASGHTKDLSALQRQKGLMQWVTMFSTYFMLAYNQQSRIVGSASQAKNIPSAIARLSWLVAVPTVLEAYLRMAVPDDADDEDLARWWGLRVLQYSASMFPVIGRPFVSAFNGFDFRLASPEALGAKWVRSLKALWNAYADDREITDKQWRDVIGSVGGVAGVSGTSQLEKALSAIQAGDDAELWELVIGHQKKQ